MSLLKSCDPLLATIRNAIQGLPKDELRRGLEQARFHVYQALQDKDLALAEQWLETLTDSAPAIHEDLWALRAAIVRATSKLKDAVKAAKRMPYGPHESEK